MKIPSRDVYAYALSVLDVLFTKKELEESLLFASAKSTKPPLENLEWISSSVGLSSNTYIILRVLLTHSCAHIPINVYMALILYFFPPAACIERRFGKDYDIRPLNAKIYHKCRDTPRVKQETSTRLILYVVKCIVMYSFCNQF